jgi:hypothetical protein
MLDDPCVVPGRERVRARAVREREQPGEAKTAVAVDARIRRLTAFVAAHKRLNDRAAKLLAQVERHMGHTERVTGGACSKDGIRGAAGTFRIGPIGIKPKPQSDADRIGERLEQCDSRVDTPTHRNRNPSNRSRSPKGRPNRVSKRIDSERLPTNRSSLEQSQPNNRTIEPGSISLDNALAVKNEPHERKVSAPRRITNELNHKLRLAAMPASAGSAGARHPRPKGVRAFIGAKSSWPGVAGPDFAT